ncbi:hypothetical protein [Xanthomonas campestris]|uniref:hypothetical protein n=1 Tax=Xanthomonas campestris TaxID=339 RepID=UPI000C28F0CD|nr:hypothetical protein [Xanthomonas campestris]MCD0261715.1 hypothetical protein [Xanthomonas campestris pv. campestris]MCD0269911.1 hypothetical protein [Xanthomonas campestris pv. campestris]PJR22811.1 hypothetical protein ASJ34_18330 [Xanthomonas campestris pv. campestris]
MTNENFPSADMLRVPYPMPDSRRCEVRNALAVGLPIGIGQATLYPDLELKVIWAVDPYGEDTFAANATDSAAIDSAIAWAENVHETGHPAERSYDF